MKRFLYKIIFYRLLGWTIDGTMQPSIKKSVLMIMPHTSWHDFYIGLFARGIIGLEMNYVAKKELFRWPVGWWFRWMGGAPLDRSGSLNTVDAIAKVFNSRDIFRLAISPEGTRKNVNKLKSGFYFIALKADVPIIPVAFDYGKKVVKLGNAFYPTGNYGADIDKLALHFERSIGKIPNNSFHFK